MIVDCCVTQLVLTIAVSEHEMQNASAQALLPSAASIVNMADSHDKAAFSSSSRPRLDTMESEAADTAEGVGGCYCRIN
jgi:hypothetical protein